MPEDSNSLDEAEVVERSRYGWEFLDQAIALWRLVDPARADAIEAIGSQAAGADEDYTRFGADSLKALVDTTWKVKRENRK